MNVTSYLTLMNNEAVKPYLSLTYALGMLLLLSMACKKPDEKQTAKPNILFLFADDLGDMDLGAYGNPEVFTPNIDRLAKDGMLFNSVYNMGSSRPAVCMPSRTMLNTGLFLWDAEQTDLQRWQQRQLFWSQQLSMAGYETYFTGKWHVPQIHPNELFDHVTHLRPGMPNQTPEGYNRPHENQPDPWSPYDPAFGGFWQGEKHWSEVLADDAVSFIDHAASQEQPFFMYLAFNAPHDPRQSPRSYVELYDPEQLALPPNFLPVYPYKNPIGAGRTMPETAYRPFPPDTPEEEVSRGRWLRDEDLAPFPRTEYAVRIHRQEFYAIISHMDTQIGRILEALEQTGQRENTIVVFTADHGLAVGQHGLLGKQNMYEHSLRVPLVIQGPGIPVGVHSNEPAYYQDIAATTLDWAGARIPAPWQFRSLVPAISGSEVTTNRYDALYGAYMSYQRAVKDWPYKLIYYPPINRWRLFDLENDPHEMHDLVDSQAPEHRQALAKLREQLIRLQQEMGDPLLFDQP